MSKKQRLPKGWPDPTICNLRMLFPVKLKLAGHEAEALRKYLLRMVEISMDKAAKNEIIILAESFPRFDSAVRSKALRPQPKNLPTYTISLPVARILWYRWQHENNGHIIQSVLGKIDYELNAQNRVPQFPKHLI